MTTRALDFARYIPAGDPVPGDTIAVVSTNPLTTEWAAAGVGGAFVPYATAPGQMIVSGPSPTFLYTPTNVGDLQLDMGTY